MKDFYNTNRERMPELAESRKQAHTQQRKILAFCRINKGEAYTPFEIQQAVFTEATPITSIRRAITNLTEMEYLQKTETMKRGRYGKANHCWTYKPKS
jgi:hypothetical protein